MTEGTPVDPSPATTPAEAETSLDLTANQQPEQLEQDRDEEEPSSSHKPVSHDPVADDVQGDEDDAHLSVEELQQEIEALEKEQARLEKENEFFDTIEDDAIIDKISFLQQILREDGTSSPLDSRATLSTMADRLEQAKRQVVEYEAQVEREVRETKEKEATLDKAQEAMEELQTAIMLETMRQERVLQEDDAELQAIQHSLEEEDPGLIVIKQTVEVEIQKKWQKIYESRKKTYEEQLAAERQRLEEEFSAHVERSERARKRALEPAVAKLTARMNQQKSMISALTKQTELMEKDIEILELAAKQAATAAGTTKGDNASGEERFSLQELQAREFNVVRSTVESLWECLQVKDEEALSFLEAAKELVAPSAEIGDLYEGELSRMQGAAPPR